VLPAPSEQLRIRSWKEVRPEDVAVITLDGERVAGSLTNPSVELPMHLSAHVARDDVNVIVHSHAEDSQIYAAIEQGIPTCTIDSYTRAGFGPIKCGKFGAVASKERDENTVEVLSKNCEAALMAEHGAIVVGSDMDDALFTAAVIEKAARQALQKRSLNRVPD
jgi:ribulose-5-phosphate 4-epimerase/fuculose-1-phosphate aldolase